MGDQELEQIITVVGRVPGEDGQPYDISRSVTVVDFRVDTKTGALSVGIPGSGGEAAKLVPSKPQA